VALASLGAGSIESSPDNCTEAAAKPLFDISTSSQSGKTIGPERQCTGWSARRSLRTASADAEVATPAGSIAQANSDTLALAAFDAIADAINAPAEATENTAADTAAAGAYAATAAGAAAAADDATADAINAIVDCARPAWAADWAWRAILTAAPELEAAARRRVLEPLLRTLADEASAWCCFDVWPGPWAAVECGDAPCSTAESRAAGEARAARAAVDAWADL
jgi:hypothetical protein